MVKNKYFRLGVFLLLLTGVALAAFTPIRQYLNLHLLYAWIHQFGFWAPLIFIGIYIIATVLFIPGTILTLAGGLLFGAWWGTLFNLSAAVIGATIAFFIARYLACDWVAEKAAGKTKLMLDGVKKEGWKFVAFIRLVPLFPFNLTNYVFGITEISATTYILTSLICMAPATFVYTYIGSLGETYVLQGGKLLATKIVFAVGMLVCLAFLPWMVRYYRSKKGGEIKL